MPRILIIDSDSAVAQGLSAALTKKSIASLVTGDGGEGLELARSESPDLIVLCVELSRGSGYSVCNKLKKDPELAKIPLILTSSQATDETFEQHKKLRTRAEAYVKKPFTNDAMVRMAGEYLRGRGASVSPEVEVAIDDMAVEAEAPGASTSSADFDVGLEETELRPAPAPKPPSRPAAAPVSSRAAAGGGSTDEARQLRQKVQQLEATLEKKELEFQDRLLEESSRGREAIEFKKKALVAERDLNKYRDLAEKAKTGLEQAAPEMERLRKQAEEADRERQVLSEKIGQLVDKVKALAAERDRLQAEVDAAHGQSEGAAGELENAARVREKAKKAVDIAVQLLRETRLLS